MRTIKVSALNSKKENCFLLLLVVLILIISYALIRITAKKNVEQKILENQISAYEDLSNVNNSFYSDLKNSLVDIEALRDILGEFPDVQTLEQEEISPFLKDKLWENRGSVLWKKIEEEGKLSYLGLSQDIHTLGNFLLEVDEANVSESKIYFLEKALLEEQVEESLHHRNEEWKEVLAYTGKEERKKF